MLKTHKNKKKNKYIVSERQYIGITATINAFRSTLASCEGACQLGEDKHKGGLSIQHIIKFRFLIHYI